MEEPLVSISCITYNHVNFIRECLDGFLMQKTTFPFEVLIHDDASTDGTTEIIKEYERKYPDIIKPIYELENQWCKGRCGSSVFNFPRAQGKYIALCEGDDYWTDPFKLQKQVDNMEANKNFTASAHSYSELIDVSNTIYYIKSFKKDIVLINDLLYRMPIHTATLLFRTEFIKTVELPMDIFSGDKAIYFLLSSFGPISYLQDSMSVHRIHSGGISQSVSQKKIDMDFCIIPWILDINPNFPKNGYLAYIYRTKYLSNTEKSYIKRLSWFFIFLKHMFLEKPINLKEILYTIVFLNNKRLFFVILDFIFNKQIEKRQAFLNKIKDYVVR